MGNEEPEVVNNEEVTQDTSVQESTPEESKEPEVDSSQDEAEGDSNEATEEQDSEDKPRGAEKRKEQLQDEIKELEGELDGEKPQDTQNREIRDLVSRRNDLRNRVKEQNAQYYRPATEEQLLDQINPETGNYYSRLEAKLAAMEQQQQISQYNEQVADAQLTLSNEAERALKDFPMFDEQSPEYNKEVAAQVDAMLGNALVFDQTTGQVIGSSVSPYQLYKTVAQSAQSGAVTGQLKAQKATEKMLASADSTGSSQQGSKSFEKMSTAEQADYLRRKGHDI